MASLSALPRELRDNIYDVLFESTEVIVRKSKHIIAITYGTTSDSPQNQRPCWLLSSKQILSEGLLQFARKAHCTRIVPYHRMPQIPATQSDSDTLLLPRVREIRLSLCLRVMRSEIEGPMGHVVHMSIFPVDVKQPTLLPSDEGVTAMQLIPSLETVTLLVDPQSLEMAGDPDLITINATRLRGLGTQFKHSLVRLAAPRLSGWEKKGDIPPVAAVARMFPRLQKMLQCTSGLVSRGYGLYVDGDEQNLESSAIVDNAYRPAQHWFASKHRMTPDPDIPEFGRLVRRNMWRKVRDWVDEEQKDWCVDVEWQDAEPEGPYEFRARGLRLFTCPELLRGGHVEIDRGGAYFELLETAERGSKSFGCASTAEVLWVEDEEKGITGYAWGSRDNEQERESVQFQGPCPRPQRWPRGPHFVAWGSIPIQHSLQNLQPQ